MMDGYNRSYFFHNVQVFSFIQWVETGKGCERRERGREQEITGGVKAEIRLPFLDRKARIGINRLGQASLLWYAPHAQIFSVTGDAPSSVSCHDAP